MTPRITIGPEVDGWTKDKKELECCNFFSYLWADKAEVGQASMGVPWTYSSPFRPDSGAANPSTVLAAFGIAQEVSSEHFLIQYQQAIQPGRQREC